MKKIYVVILLLFSYEMSAENIIKSKSAKKESVQSMKQQLAHGYEDLIHVATSSVKTISTLIDDIVSQIKQLAGDGEGDLLTADKKTLKLYQEKVIVLQEQLEQIVSTCNLKIAVS